jgi:hypothetical protein
MFLVTWLTYGVLARRCDGTFASEGTRSCHLPLATVTTVLDSEMAERPGTDAAHGNIYQAGAGEVEEGLEEHTTENSKGDLAGWWLAMAERLTSAATQGAVAESPPLAVRETVAEIQPGCTEVGHTRVVGVACAGPCSCRRKTEPGTSCCCLIPIHCSWAKHQKWARALKGDLVRHSNCLRETWRAGGGIAGVCGVRGKQSAALTIILQKVVFRCPTQASVHGDWENRGLCFCGNCAVGNLLANVLGYMQVCGHVEFCLCLCSRGEGLSCSICFGFVTFCSSILDCSLCLVSRNVAGIFVAPRPRYKPHHHPRCLAGMLCSLCSMHVHVAQLQLLHW